MVDLMGPANLSQPRQAGEVPALDTAMNGHVVQDEVHHAVGCNSETDTGHKIVAGGEPEIDGCCGRRTEKKRKDVVELEEAFARPVMGLMDGPERTVHDVFMEGPTEGFHSYESRHDCQYEDHLFQKNYLG